MNTRIWQGLAVVVFAGLLLLVWRQQQTIDDLSQGTSTPIPDAAIAGQQTAEFKATPPLSNVDIRVPVAGAAIRGNASAEAVIIEYSDFECPYCGRYVRNTLPRLNQEYVDTGKIRYVFKQFPLEGIHPQAMGAAVVSSCAIGPGKFWELHDALFASQGALDMPSLLASAGRLGMSDAAFKACVEQQSPSAMIQAARQEAVAAGFVGTPGFLVGRMGSDGMVHATRRLYGANPYSLFQSAINDVLAGK